MSSPDEGAPDSPVEGELSYRHTVQRVATTVLVVDDDADIRASISELLEDHGYTTIEARDGRQALEHLQQRQQPACLILDLWMPELDGWSLATAMGKGEVPSVPTILVTAASSDSGYPVPAGQVLRKPIDPDQLLRLVATLTRPGR
jgi:two-component system OmpR family response regulator